MLRFGHPRGVLSKPSDPAFECHGFKKVFDRQQPHAVKRVETPEQASVFSPPNLYFGLIMAESPGKPLHDIYKAVPDRLLLEYGVDDLCDLERQQGRNSIPDLMVLLSSISLEKVVVRERLKSCGLTDGEASALRGIWVNEVMSVLGNMTCHGGAWDVIPLDSEPVNELATFPVCMSRRQTVQGELEMTLRSPLIYFCKNGCVKIAPKIAVHMRPGFMIEPDFNLFVLNPLIVPG